MNANPKPYQLDPQGSVLQEDSFVARWTHDDVIAFECACECITDLRGIRLAQIREEESKPNPDAETLASLRAESSRLYRERHNLQIEDHAEVARIRSEYGALVRTLRAQRKAAREAGVI